MRTLADFIHPRVNKLICEKFLTRPIWILVSVYFFWNFDFDNLSPHTVINIKGRCKITSPDPKQIMIHIL